MPQSKNRPHHHPAHHVPPPHSVAKKSSRAIITTVIFFAIIGLGIGFFASDEHVVIWLIAGTVIGAICGYYFGRQIDKTISKNK